MNEPDLIAVYILDMLRKYPEFYDAVDKNEEQLINKISAIIAAGI